MKGKIESGQLVTVEPVGNRQLMKGDIVLCKVNGSQYLHLIKAIQGRGIRSGTISAGSMGGLGSVRSMGSAPKFRIKVGYKGLIF